MTTYHISRRRLIGRLPAWAAGGGALWAPGSAHASFLAGEALDNVANILSWVVLVVVPVIGVIVFWLVHILPEKIAHRKKHPQTHAIQGLCLLSLVFGGLLWPIAWLWAYSKPVPGSRSTSVVDAVQEFTPSYDEEASRPFSNAMKIPTNAAPMIADSSLAPLCRISLLGFLLALPTALPVSAQTPAAPAPAAAAPATTEPSRAAVEQFIPQLKTYIATREVTMTRLVNRITALDQSIQSAVQQVLGLLTPSRDSVQTRTNVARLKQETIAGLKRAAEAYNQRRSLVAEELRTTQNEYRREDLFASRGQLDTRIDKMIDAMVQLALSMETDEGHERFIQDSSVTVTGGGRWGISVPTTKRNPEFDQNRRQAARTRQTTTELDTAFDASLNRLDIQERSIVTQLAAPNVSEPDKARLVTELERIKGIREERVRQRTLLDSGGDEVSPTPIGRSGFVEMEELVESITAGARRDFTRMMADFNELRSERQAIAELRARLDFSEQWLAAHPDAK